MNQSPVNIDVNTGSGGGGGGSGAVVAVRSVTMFGTMTTTSTSWVDVTDGVNPLSITYTPTSASNKIRIVGALSISGEQLGAFRLMRGASAIAVGNADGSRTQATAGGDLQQTYQVSSQAVLYHDSPATTSSTTWKVQVMSLQGSTVAINRPNNNDDGAYVVRVISTLEISEITPP